MKLFISLYKMSLKNKILHQAKTKLGLNWRQSLGISLGLWRWALF
jgi:hypothetical protein